MDLEVEVVRVVSPVWPTVPRICPALTGTPTAMPVLIPVMWA